jgi:ABC-2 type transport system ATP-binding protein
MAGGRLRFHGAPETLMASAEGQVWQWTLPADQLAEARTRLKISRAQRRTDGVEVRVVGARPSDDAVPVAPDLEDAYLWLLHCGGEAAA